MYLERHISEYISRMRKQYKVLLLTGPRQVGKSTMLQHMYSNDYSYVVLDDYLELETAKNDPALFLKTTGCLSSSLRYKGLQNYLCK